MCRVEEIGQGKAIPVVGRRRGRGGDRCGLETSVQSGMGVKFKLRASGEHLDSLATRLNPSRVPVVSSTWLEYTSQYLARKLS